jgi:hypothetical protein
VNEGRGPVRPVPQPPLEEEEGLAKLEKEVKKGRVVKGGVLEVR